MINLRRKYVVINSDSYRLMRNKFVFDRQIRNESKTLPAHHDCVFITPLFNFFIWLLGLEALQSYTKVELRCQSTSIPSHSSFL